MAEQGSIIERLRAQRKSALAPKNLTLEVPGWSGLLHVRYKPAEWERVWALLQGGADLSAKEALDSNIEALTAACDALLVKVDDGVYPDVKRDKKSRASLGDVLRAQGEEVHGDVKFDVVAVDVLNLTVKDAIGQDRPADGVNEACLAAFGGAVSPELAVSAHASALGSWMAGNERVAELGE